MSHMITNPATLAPLGEVPESGTEAIGHAVAAARAAVGPWRNTPAARRAALLKEIANRIRILKITLWASVVVGIVSLIYAYLKEYVPFLFGGH